MFAPARFVPRTVARRTSQLWTLDPWIVVLITLVIYGCGGARSTDPTTTSPVHDNAWFCQMATQDGWECVQDAALVANPRPDRLPTTPVQDEESANGPPMARVAQPEMAPALAAVPPPVEANTRTRPVQSPDTPPVEPPTKTNTTREPPTYQRLAYRPERPMKLTDLPPGFLAVQLVAVTSKEALEEFVKRRNVVGMSAARIAKGEQIYYVLLLGVYPDMKSAELAAADRPPPLRDLTPWIRPLGTLQEAMRAADALTGSTEF